MTEPETLSSEQSATKLAHDIVATIDTEINATFRDAPGYDWQMLHDVSLQIAKKVVGAISGARSDMNYILVATPEKDKPTIPGEPITPEGQVLTPALILAAVNAIEDEFLTRGDIPPGS